MTLAEQHLLALARAGLMPTPADVVQTITSPAEMAGCEAGLVSRGAKNGDALAAIEGRKQQMGWKG
jgi:hypothetical protein